VQVGAWDVVQAEGVRVFDDPANGRVHVVGEGSADSFDAAGRVETPTVLRGLGHVGASFVPGRAVLTASGTPRWRDWEGWHGPEGLLPALGEARDVRILAKSLVETALYGPATGTPRVRCVFPQELVLPQREALVALRGETVLMVFEGEAIFRVDVGTCELLRVGVQGTPTWTLPGLDPTGRWGAVAVQRGKKTVVVVLDGATPVAKAPLDADIPSVLTVGAGAVFAEDYSGRVHRLALPAADEKEASSRDQAISRHRTGLWVRLREQLEAKDPAGAVDTLDALRAAGLTEVVSAEEKALTAQAAELARPFLVAASGKARADGHSGLARAIDRRAVLLGLPEGPVAGTDSVPLQIALDAEGVELAVVRDWREKAPFETVTECPRIPRGEACVEIHVGGNETLSSDEQKDASEKKSIRRRLEEDFDSRAACLDDGQVVLDETPAGPRSAFLCDIATGGVERRYRLASAVAEYDWNSQLSRERVSVRLVDGTRWVVPLPDRIPKTLFDKALEAALELQAQADLEAARRGGGTPELVEQALRSIAWRGAAADDDVRAAIRGDGSPRASWFGIGAPQK